MALPHLRFKGQLYPFQEEVLKWMQGKSRGIIGLDMGMGKTVITIAQLCQQPLSRVIIVVPLPILEQWRFALLKFTDIRDSEIAVFQGPKRHELNLSSFRLILTTYEIIRYDALNFPGSPLWSATYDCLIIDEAHRLRNKSTQTFQTCFLLQQRSRMAWLLTGTTIHNSLEDFYNLRHFLGIEVSIPNQACYMRMTKEDVNLHLPEKTIHDHYMRMGHKQEREYNEILQEVKEETDMGAMMVKILRLRQCCNASLSHKKRQSVKFTRILEILSKVPKGEKTIIFSQWGQSLEQLRYFLNKNVYGTVMYHGELEQDDRKKVLTYFCQGATPILLATLTAGGVGLDLSCANHVILMDSWWNQSLEAQAIDRVYRIGQTKRVEIHHLYMLESIEEWMVKMKEEKHKVDTQFHDKKKAYQTDHAFLKDLLHSYIGGYSPL